jgi:hypothetical protein
VPRGTSSSPPGKSREQRIKGSYYIKFRNASIKTRATICTSQKIPEESYPSTQLQQIDLIMGNTLQKAHQYNFNDLPTDLIQRIVLCSDYVTALSVTYTCKKFYEGLNILLCPKLTSVPYKMLENGELAHERKLLLREISLNYGSFNTIPKCYPKLKYLLIDYSCKWDDNSLDFWRYSELQRIFANLNVSNLNTGKPSNSLHIIGSCTMKHLTFHISRIDPVTSKIIPDIYEQEIYILLYYFSNFNCW